MNILICGATGFIGRHLSAALEQAGHTVLRGMRAPRLPQDRRIDYTRIIRAEDVAAQLDGVDVLINAVGILGEQGGATFEAVHHVAPVALFEACVRAGVHRVIQISAAGGGDPARQTPYMHTKRAADAALMALPLDWIILRPSLVVGTDGDSSRFFRMLSSLPVIGLPGRGDQQLQPVHVDDLAQAVVLACEPGATVRTVLEAVGPEPITYRGMLAAYRDAMDLRPPLWLPIPMPLMQVSASVASLLPQKVFTRDTLRMLQEGNVADPTPFAQWLGCTPAPASAWFAGESGNRLRAEALLAWWEPMFRIVLAFVWIVTGMLSLGVFPVDQSLALLSRVGLQGRAADAALYGAALLDIAFGMATLFRPGRLLWLLQGILILGYTAIISVFLPEFWLHPFGPLLKNLPILALLAALYAFDSARPSGSSHPSGKVHP